MGGAGNAERQVVAAEHYPGLAFHFSVDPSDGESALQLFDIVIYIHTPVLAKQALPIKLFLTVNFEGRF